MPNVRITKIRMGSLAKYMAAVAVKMHAAANCDAPRQQMDLLYRKEAGMCHTAVMNAIPISSGLELKAEITWPLLAVSTRAL